MTTIETPSGSARAAMIAAISGARTSMATFMMIMRPGFKLPRHQRMICDALDDVAAGRTKRLIITMPPQHGKTECAIRTFIPYYLGRRPKGKVIVSSYGFELVSRFSLDARRTVASDNYRAIFPGTVLAQDAKAVAAWETTEGGRVIAAGREGSITGHSADLIIADDLLSNREEAESPTMLEKVWDFFASGLISRAHKDTAIILIGTRWSAGDPTGRVLASAGSANWRILNFPAIAEEGDPLGRSPGEALWPDRHPIELLESKRQDIGEHEFQSLYQGRPFARGGQYIKRAWFRECEPCDLPAGLLWCRGLDLAVSVKKAADYSASVRVARYEDTIFIDGGWYRRAEWPTIKAVVVSGAMAEPDQLAVEAVAGFDVAYRELAEALAGFCIVHKVTATKDKLTRALPWISAAEMGRVVIVRRSGDSWVGEFLAQCEAFPGAGTHDDLVDALSIGYEKLKRKGVQLSFALA